MTHKVFVSHSSKDAAAANAITARLEQHGHPCWIAPRDVDAGLVPWPEQVIEAINSASTFVLVFSSNANESDPVKREVDIAVKNGIPIIPLRIEDVTPSKTLEFYTSLAHWLDAITPPIDDHMERLVAAIEKLADKGGSAGGGPPPPPSSGMNHAGGAPIAPLIGQQLSRSRPLVNGTLAGLALALVTAGAIYWGLGPPDSGAGWFSVLLALVVPLAIALTGFAIVWRSRLTRYCLMALFVFSIATHAWMSSNFVYTDGRNSERVRGLACTAELLEVDYYADRCPYLTLSDLADFGNDETELWPAESIRLSKLLISGSWVLMIIFGGCLLGGYLIAHPIRIAGS